MLKEKRLLLQIIYLFLSIKRKITINFISRKPWIKERISLKRDLTLGKNVFHLIPNNCSLISDIIYFLYTYHYIV